LNAKARAAGLCIVFDSILPIGDQSRLVDERNEDMQAHAMKIHACINSFLQCFVVKLRNMPACLARKAE
jgi:hypothetical protein